MILCVVGPTGIGKTKLSIALAKKYNAIIINADAMQVYKKMDIGTAKVTESEKEGIPHYLFDIADIKTNFTVFDYQKEARKIIEENKDKNMVFVGGTGLYLKAALFNYVFEPETKKNEEYEALTNEELFELAIKKDKNMNIHINNRKRLIRFLNKEKNEIERCYPLYDAVFIGLTTNREMLYNIINNRVDNMFQDGLLEEVKYFFNKEIDSKAINTAIGYKELYQYFKGEISLEEAKELIKKNSRHYAKRQYTWFNNQMNVTWFEVNFEDFNSTITEIINYIDKE